MSEMQLQKKKCTKENTLLCLCSLLSYATLSFQTSLGIGGVYLYLTKAFHLHSCLGDLLAPFHLQLFAALEVLDTL